MSNQVCGRDYEIVLPMIRHMKDKNRPRVRVHVKGLNKADGNPIRFKSLQRAENHIHNMRLQLD